MTDYFDPHCPCKVCQEGLILILRAQVVELEEKVSWLEGMLESSRQVNRMWEDTARYAIKKLDGVNDTQTT